MMKLSFLVLLAVLWRANGTVGQTLPAGLVLKDVPGGVFTMGSNSLMGSPAQQVAAPEHQVTLTPYSLGESEVTNSQYTEFLNSSLIDGLIEISIGTFGPDNGKRLVVGTAQSSYLGKVLYNLDGSRVLKDHDNADGDDNEFTGGVEPENPLNVSYIGFDDTVQLFYVKDPLDTNDFDWVDVCNYQDYGTTPMFPTGPVLNDFDDWSGSGLNYSDELEAWTASNPAAAINIPLHSEVAEWPVTFIRWWGAQAFVEYYDLSLPTEAQWEFAAKGGSNFQYAVYDGINVSEANWNQAGMGQLATGHVRLAISGTANPYGLYNLAGNSWEWIADNYVEPYETVAVTDPLIVDAGSTSRCWRGGSWNYHEATLQTSIRFYDEENRGNDHFGFRVAGTNSMASVENHDQDIAYKLYPNPVAESLTVTLHNEGERSLTLYSSEGKLVLSKYIQKTLEIDVSDLERGVYFLSIDNVIQKLIIQ